ncbi:uncharacterized protein DS421_14g483310 [Arachis hypogaea]|nr:uncharacterized protein DS421_14g483310 [Arachis hypogaea]
MNVFKLLVGMSYMLAGRQQGSRYLQKDTPIFEVGKNKFLITIKDERRGIELLKGGPWSIRGHLLNLQLWTQREAIYEIKHDYMMIWVQIHGVPQQEILAIEWE